MRNDDDAATDAWKKLTAASVPNISILEGGINNWIATFGNDNPEITSITSEHFENDTLRYLFESELGGRYECPDPNPHNFELEFESKLELKRDKSDGDAVI